MKISKTFSEYLATRTESAEIAQQMVTQAFAATRKLEKTAGELLKGFADPQGNLLHNMMAYAEHLPSDAASLRSTIGRDKDWFSGFIHNMNYAISRAQSAIQRGNYPDKEQHIQHLEKIREKLGST